ncbi:MAG: hypothetical protein WCL00_07915 [Bacteroidota bacterium]
MFLYIHNWNRLFVIFLLTVPGLSPVFSGTKALSSVQVTFHVTLSCTVETPLKSHIRLTLVNAPFTSYEALTDSLGTAILQSVSTGQYNIQVHRFNYGTWYGQANIKANFLQNVQLNQLIKPPSGLETNSHSLIATWKAPPIDTTLFSEDWSSGNLATNGWTTSGGTNWMISNSLGHNAPSVTFHWSPVVTNYDQYLTSSMVPACYASKVTF